jgi:Zn-dependent protease/CBS domain-containing protein
LDGSIRIGRLFGFDIGIHWSWILIFFIVTLIFADGVLPEFYEEWTDGQRWIVGAGISIVFFCSILLHEMSHSIVARGYGLPVTSITLFVFGGVSNLGKEPASAKQEFWISIVGPLTSFGMAGLFALGFLVLIPFDDGAAGVSLQLAVINLAIGVFNLVPGFPLDGGRVLRSIVWWRNGNLLQATRIASMGGQVVSFLMMGLGVFAFFFASWFTGIWLFLIGNFLRGASQASYQSLFVQTMLRGVPATRLARRDYIALSPEVTIKELVDDYVLDGKGRCFPVLAGEELLGLITLTDVRQVAKDDWWRVTVYRAMTPFDKLKTVKQGDDLQTVLEVMALNDVNQVPLVDGRVLAGLIHRADIVRFLQVREELGRPGQPAVENPV